MPELVGIVQILDHRYENDDDEGIYNKLHGVEFDARDVETQWKRVLNEDSTLMR